MLLRPYQQRAVSDLRDAYRYGAKAPLLQLATGGGKTIIFSAITASAAAKGRRVLVAAHWRELIRQASAKLHDAGVPHGIIAPWAPRTDSPVQVASIQTLARRLDDLPAFGLVVIDECHHATAATYKALIEAQPGAKLLGVTATPERADGRGLGVASGGCFDALLCGPSVAELIRDGYLSKYRAFAPAGDGPDLSGVGKRGGDYAVDQLAAAMMKPAITGNAAEHYAKHAAKKATVCFCVSVKHAEEVAEAFRAAGWRAKAVSGATPTDERDAAIAGLADGSVQILSACDLISEGLDVPRIECVILLRPTLSLGLHLQQVGRGLRPAADKPHLVILDAVGNCLKHGLPADPREWSLDSKPRRLRKRDKPAGPRCCPNCGCVTRAPVCEACGEVMGAPREIERRPGELVELTPRELRRIKYAPLRHVLNGTETFPELQRIAKLRGYHPKWARHALEEQAERRAGAGR